MEQLGRREGGEEFGGDLFEAFLALEMRDALHAPAAVVRISCAHCQDLAFGSPGPQSNLSQLGETLSEPPETPHQIPAA